MSNNTFYALHSSNNTSHYQTLGGNGDEIVEADLDGDGSTDYVVYLGSIAHSLAGTWYWRLSSESYATEHSRLFGLDFSHDHAAPGDYDGDGKTDLAVRRRTGEFPGFYVRRSSDSEVTFQRWGLVDDAVLATTVHTR